MRQAHRVEATRTEDGTLMRDGLPFQAGDAVEVIVLPYAPSAPAQNTPQNTYPLRGTSIQYERPTEPVASEDWAVSE